ncbi:MAG TPA: nucleoside deaminase [Bacteroidetes bacterium]|nr:nucleoside deaminase [Bacteroidota bacterium]
MDEPINESLPDFFSDEYFMKEALKEAQKALDQDEIPVGAVITCKNRIVARAHNLTETLGDVTAHAEMQAITAAAEYLGGKYLTDCTIYITLEPCSMCAAALGWAQIQRIVYGTSDPKKGFTRFSSRVLHPKTLVSSGILETESRQVLEKFFHARRK